MLPKVPVSASSTPPQTYSKLASVSVFLHVDPGNNALLNSPRDRTASIPSLGGSERTFHARGRSVRGSGLSAKAPPAKSTRLALLSCFSVSEKIVWAISSGDATLNLLRRASAIAQSSESLRQRSCRSCSSFKVQLEKRWEITSLEIAGRC